MIKGGAQECKLVFKNKNFLFLLKHSSCLLNLLDFSFILQHICTME